MKGHYHFADDTQCTIIQTVLLLERNKDGIIFGRPGKTLENIHP